MVENSLTKPHERINHLEEKLQQKTVLKGLKIKTVKAKSQSGDLQKKFDEILQEIELKLLDSTLESLRKVISHRAQAMLHSKEGIKASIDP